MKRSILGCMSAVCLVALGLVEADTASAVELLANPSLDLTVPYNPAPAIVSPQPASWTVIGTKTVSGAFTDVLSSEPWAGPAPTPVTTNGTGNEYGTGTGCSGLDCGVFFKPFSGNLATGDLATGHLEQTLPAVPGNKYTLSGWVGAQGNYSGLLAGSQTRTELTLDFLDNGLSLLSSAVLDLKAAGLGAPNGQSFNYKNFGVIAFAPAGAAFVRPRVSMIDAYSNPAGGGQALVVDDLSLVTVPEPSALVVVALGTLITLAVRRRG